jgi:hypothetical protein
MRNSRLYMLYSYLRIVGMLTFGTVVIAFFVSIYYAVDHASSGHSQKQIIEGLMWPWWALVLVAAIGMLFLSDRRNKLRSPTYSRGKRLLAGMAGVVAVVYITFWWWLEGMWLAIRPHTRFTTLLDWTELTLVVMFAVGFVLALRYLPCSQDEWSERAALRYTREDVLEIILTLVDSESPMTVAELVSVTGHDADLVVSALNLVHCDGALRSTRGYWNHDAAFVDGQGYMVKPEAASSYRSSKKLSDRTE